MPASAPMNAGEVFSDSVRRSVIPRARAAGAFAPLGERVLELWSAAAEKLGPNLDQTEVARYWEEANGVTLASNGA